MRNYLSNLLQQVDYATTFSTEFIFNGKPYEIGISLFPKENSLTNWFCKTVKSNLTVFSSASKSTASSALRFMLGTALSIGLASAKSNDPSNDWVVTSTHYNGSQPDYSAITVFVEQDNENHDLFRTYASTLLQLALNSTSDEIFGYDLPGCDTPLQGMSCYRQQYPDPIENPNHVMVSQLWALFNNTSENMERYAQQASLWLSAAKELDDIQQAERFMVLILIGWIFGVGTPFCVRQCARSSMLSNLDGTPISERRELYIDLTKMVVVIGSGSALLFLVLDAPLMALMSSSYSLGVAFGLCCAACASGGLVGTTIALYNRLTRMRDTYCLRAVNSGFDTVRDCWHRLFRTGERAPLLLQHQQNPELVEIVHAPQ